MWWCYWTTLTQFLFIIRFYELLNAFNMLRCSQFAHCSCTTIVQHFRPIKFFFSLYILLFDARLPIFFYARSLCQWSLRAYLFVRLIWMCMCVCVFMWNKSVFAEEEVGFGQKNAHKNAMQFEIIALFSPTKPIDSITSRFI